MPNLKTITVTFHINEDTGKVVNMTRHDGSPADNATAPPGTITDCQSFVVSRVNPYCISYQIGNTWYTVCYP
jgi:hypothetical protein